MNSQFENPEVLVLEAFASDEISHDGAFEVLIFGLRTQRKPSSTERGEPDGKAVLFGRKTHNSELRFVFQVWQPTIIPKPFCPFLWGLFLSSFFDRVLVAFPLDCRASCDHMLRFGLPSGH